MSPNDKNAVLPTLSPTAERIRALRATVLNRWEQSVRSCVAQARTLGQPILINTLPVFYENIVESLSSNYPRTSAVDGTTVASEHGGERARVTAYDQGALIQEYQILRITIFDILHEQAIVIDHQETRAINSSIDSAIFGQCASKVCETRLDGGYVATNTTGSTGAMA